MGEKLFPLLEGSFKFYSSKDVFCYCHNTFIAWQHHPDHNSKVGPVRELNPGPLAPEARIIPLDQQATLPVANPPSKVK